MVAHNFVCNKLGLIEDLWNPVIKELLLFKIVVVSEFALLHWMISISRVQMGDHEPFLIAKLVSLLMIE
jgi:hypothetical protein